MRQLWVDRLKALTIFLVVWGHLMSCDAFVTDYGNACYMFIGSFHMPLFAVLSGWWFSVGRGGFGTYLRKKSIALMLPYVVWGFLWFFCVPGLKLVFSGEEIHPSTLVWLGRYFAVDGLCHYGWWFLRALFFCFLVAWVSVRLCKGRYDIAGVGSCLLLYGLCFAGIIPNMASKDDLLKGFVFLYPFFWTGFAFHRLESRLTASWRWLLPSALLTFAVLFSFWDGYSGFYSMNTSAIATSGVGGVIGWEVVGRTIYRYVTGTVASLAFLLIGQRFFRRDSDTETVVGESGDARTKSLSDCLVTFVDTVGRNTLGIYILQSLVYWSLPAKLQPGWGEVGNFIFSFALSIVVTVAASIIVSFTARYRIPALLLWGRTKSRM